jgi:peptide chain release factor subunit 1
MAEIDQETLRKLAAWNADGVPVASLYLDVDGRRYPRKQDYTLRFETLCHELQRQAEPLGKQAVWSVAKDTRRMQEYLASLDRGHIRGLAMFSASGAGLWHAVAVPTPVPDCATVADQPYVLRLEALLQTYETFCTALVDRERARIFLSRLGAIAEQTDVLDDVPGKHDQGGWAQARYQRHIEDHVARHLKHTGELLLRLFKRNGFDHLILAGPDEVLAELERTLHDYLTRRIVARISLPRTSSPDQVLERSLAVEERVQAERERSIRDRVVAESAAGRHAVTGLPAVLDALNEGRVDTLVAPFGVSAEGRRCASCGRLEASNGSPASRGKCRTCGGEMEPVRDVVESAVAAALRQRSRVESLPFTGAEGLGQGMIGALLRY